MFALHSNSSGTEELGRPAFWGKVMFPCAVALLLCPFSSRMSGASATVEGTIPGAEEVSGQVYTDTT